MQGIEELLQELREPADPATGARLLIALRLRKLASIGTLMGEAAIGHVKASVAARLTEEAGPGDFVANLGEGTFVVLQAARPDHAEAVARALVESVSRRIPFGEFALHAPANAGVCVMEGRSEEPSRDLDRAMRALQRAMARGPGMVEAVSKSKIERAARDWELRSLLEEASLRGEFSLHYQTIHDIASGAVRSLEALLRWRSPGAGPVGPDRFVPMLEESGLIRPVGEWVLREAALQARRWCGELGLAHQVAVNLSPVQLEGEGFGCTAQRVMAETGCEARWIEFEITEGAVIRDFAHASRQIQALSEMGFRIVIDDFGAGYSSLGQLSRLGVHHLKADQSLIAGLPDGSKRESVVRAVVALADVLELGVTFEGVEHPAQAEWLERFPDLQAQGYLFSRPASAADAEGLLRARRSESAERVST